MHLGKERFYAFRSLGQPFRINAMFLPLTFVNVFNVSKIKSNGFLNGDLS